MIEGNRSARKLAGVIGAMTIAMLVTSGASAQMGGGGMMGSGGMMGGFGNGGGYGSGMTGGNGRWPGSDNGYEPRKSGVPRDPSATAATRPALLDDIDLAPFRQLGLSNRQLGAISSIREELMDRQLNGSRRLAAEEEKLRGLYDAPKLDRGKIDAQFHRIKQLRRELFESSLNARDGIVAQLNTEQQQRLRRIAPQWKTGD